MFPLPGRVLQPLAILLSPLPAHFVKKYSLALFPGGRVVESSPEERTPGSGFSPGFSKPESDG